MTIQEAVAAFLAEQPKGSMYDAKEWAAARLPEAERIEFLDQWHKARFGIPAFPKMPEEMFPKSR